ncbi:MAG: esterase-like activity of phytase family protein [Aeromicrobium sp.]
MPQFPARMVIVAMAVALSGGTLSSCSSDPRQDTAPTAEADAVRTPAVASAEPSLPEPSPAEPGETDSADPDPAGATLSGWSALPADTFTAGSEPSGHFLEGSKGPFDGQPVEGFSAVHVAADGSYLAVSDNGFGSRKKSPDFILRVHRLQPDPRTGSVTVLGGVDLSDPDELVPWKIWRDGGCADRGRLPDGYSCPPPDRTLTGWDFDPEAFQVAPDGTFWLGDEYGPFLLHTDATGVLLSPPVQVPGVSSPSSPTLGGSKPNLPDSKGFEGMAISPDGGSLRPMLEGAPDEDLAGGRASDQRIYDVTVTGGVAAFSGDYLRYRRESRSHALGDFIAVNDNEFLVIERDDASGSAAGFKRIYLVDRRDRDHDGYVDKRLLVDLLKVRNPDRLGGFADPFRFSYFTIEDVDLVDGDTIAVLNDNNYPSTGGRGDDVEDVSEIVLIDLPVPLAVDDRLLPAASPVG